MIVLFFPIYYYVYKCYPSSARTLIEPIRRRVYVCLWGMVLSYPFRLFFLKICSIFPFVCSTTVASTATWLEGMTGEPRRVYSREPISCIWDNDKTSPKRTSLRRGTVKRSFGERRYFLPAIEAITYWLGCERIRASAREVDEGVCGLVWSARVNICRTDGTGTNMRRIREEKGSSRTARPCPHHDLQLARLSLRGAPRPYPAPSEEVETPIELWKSGKVVALANTRLSHPPTGSIYSPLFLPPSFLTMQKIALLNASRMATLAAAGKVVSFLNNPCFFFSC